MDEVLPFENLLIFNPFEVFANLHPTENGQTLASSKTAYFHILELFVNFWPDFWIVVVLILSPSVRYESPFFVGFLCFNFEKYIVSFQSILKTLTSKTRENT